MNRFPALALAALAVLTACESSPSRSSEREWALAECRNIIDKEAQKKCLERVDDDYGRFHR
jgi:hypothetical protein